jgi:hypothetical protein
MYVGLHHLVQILYYNQTLCVCVYVCVYVLPRPKVGNKPSFGAIHSFCRNPTLAKCGGEAQHLEKVRIWSPPRLPNV